MRTMLLRALGSMILILTLFAGWLIFDGVTDDISPSDIAVVLGNKVNPDGSPSPRLKARLDRAVELYQTGQVRQLLVSGATGIEGVPEGDAMRAYLLTQGIPSEAILVDNAGVDTWSTALNTVRTMRAENLESAIVVTQYFHVARTQLAFQKAGLIVGSAHARYFELRDFYSTCREVPAYISYLFRRGLEAD